MFLGVYGGQECEVPVSTCFRGSDQRTARKEEWEGPRVPRATNTALDFVLKSAEAIGGLRARTMWSHLGCGNSDGLPGRVTRGVERRRQRESTRETNG